MTSIEKIKFLDVFTEGKDESLILKVKLSVNDETFEAGKTFEKGEKIASVDFHILRYFDLAVNYVGDTYEVKGIFPKK